MQTEKLSIKNFSYMFLAVLSVLIVALIPKTVFGAGAVNDSSVSSFIADVSVGNQEQSYQSGLNLTYDIYTKSGPGVTASHFSDGYLHLSGWVASLGKGHHYDQNSMKAWIYFVPQTFNGQYVDDVGTGEFLEVADKYYKVDRSYRVDVRGDYFYNDRSERFTFNLCSSGQNNKSNVTSESNGCNMRYDNVGFKVSIPMEDLFGSGNLDLGGADKQLKYDMNILYVYNNTNVANYRLKTPIKAWGTFKADYGDNHGVLTFESGSEYQTVVPRKHVLRRTVARTRNNTVSGYFTEGAERQVKAVSNNTNVNYYGSTWLQVYQGGNYWSTSGNFYRKTPTSSVTFKINGKTCPNGKVVLMTEDCYVVVTHIYKDLDTGKNLVNGKDENGNNVVNPYINEEVVVGSDYIPENDKVVPHLITNPYTYTDNLGESHTESDWEYIELDTNPTNVASKMMIGNIQENKTLIFYFSPKAPEPRNKVYDYTNGILGNVYWKLYKKENETESMMEVANQLYTDGEAYEIRNKLWEIDTADHKEENEEEPIITPELSVQDDKLKDDKINYKYSYEYTNVAKPITECLYEEHGSCIELRIVEYVPYWKDMIDEDRAVEPEKVEELEEDVDYGFKEAEVELELGHDYGETHLMDFEEGNEDSGKMSTKHIVGQTGVIEERDAEAVIETQEEELSVEQKVKYDFKTQSYLPIMEKDMNYEVDFKDLGFFPHIFSEENSQALVPDVDINLQDQFSRLPDDLNELTDNIENLNYGIPLSLVDSNAVSENKFEVNIEVLKDFYLGSSTGFLFTADKEATTELLNNTAEGEYLNYTLAEFKDNIITNKEISKNSYHMPVYADSENGEALMKPNTEYRNVIILRQMGLNDLTTGYIQNYEFKNYLLGTVFETDGVAEGEADTAWTVEQSESVIGGDIYTNSIVIDSEEMQAKLYTDVVEARTMLIHGFKSTDAVSMFERINDMGLISEYISGE